MSFLEVSTYFSHWEVGERAVRSALQNRGYSRRLPRRKPALSEETRILRKSWAEAHRHWSTEDWMLVLWSDETYVNDGGVRPVYITRKVSYIILLKKFFVLTYVQGRRRIRGYLRQRQVSKG